MARVLLVDTSFSAAPIYQALLALGHEVHVVGNRPEDYLAKVCNRYWNISYAEVEILKQLVANEDFNFIVPGCTDLSYRSCSKLSNGRFPGLDFPEVESTINNKAYFRALARRLGLQAPRVLWSDVAGVESEENLFPLDIETPIIIKPVDGYSGRGITVLWEIDQVSLMRGIEYARIASPSGKCLIEDYMEGQLYSFSCNIQGERVIASVLIKEFGTADPFVVDTSWVVQNPREALKERLTTDVEALASHLQLCDGLVHMQFILVGDVPYIIEVTRRCPGDLYSQLVDLSGEGSYAERYVAPFLGLQITKNIVSQSQRVLRHSITAKGRKPFRQVRFERPLSKWQWVPLALTGQELKHNQATRIGILFAEESDDHSFEALQDATLQRKLYRIES